MRITLSYSPNRYASLSYRTMHRNRYWMGKIIYMGAEWALCFNEDLGQYEAHCKGRQFLVLPLDETAYYVNRENAKRGASYIGPDNLPSTPAGYLPTVSDTSPEPQGKPGRPPTGKAMRQLGISLTEDQVAYCRSISYSANLGEGVRACIDSAIALQAL